MSEMHLGVVEARFADIIWSHEPVTSSQLVRLCREQLQWKKSTTFTVLRRLCEKGLFQNVDGTVTARMTREEYDSLRSQQFVEEAFAGSLPAFLAAFTARKELTAEEVAHLRAMVDQYEEG